MNLFAILACLRLGGLHASASRRSRVSLLVMALVTALVAAPISASAPTVAASCCCKDKTKCVCHRRGSPSRSGESLFAKSCATDATSATQGGDPKQYLAGASTRAAQRPTGVGLWRNRAALHLSLTLDLSRYQRPPPAVLS